MYGINNNGFRFDTPGGGPFIRMMNKVRARGLVGSLVLAGVASATLEAVVVHGDWTLGDSAVAADTAVFDSVGWVEIQEGSSTYRGTGVLVAADWVLTAAHNWLAEEVTGLNFHLGGTAYTATLGQWYQHPGWQANPEVGPAQGWDMALFHLVQPVTGITAAPRYSGSKELGASILFGGYGLAGTATTGPRPNAAPTLYAAWNTIDRVVSITGEAGMGGALLADFDDGGGARNSLAGAGVYDTSGASFSFIPNGTISAQSSSATFVALEGTTASGDSGGPAFADFGNGYELVGLVSWGVNPTNPGNLYGSGYGDVTYFTRVSSGNDWIAAIIPEPNRIGLVGLSLIGSLASRARRRGRSRGCGREGNSPPRPS